MAVFSLTPFTFNIASYSNTCCFWIQSCSPEICDSAVPFPAFPKSLNFYPFMISINENVELIHCNVSWNYFQNAAMFWVLSSNLPLGNLGRNNNAGKGKTCEMPVTIFFHKQWFHVVTYPASSTTLEHPSLPTTSFLSRGARGWMLCTLFRPKQVLVYGLLHLYLCNSLWE